MGHFLFCFFCLVVFLAAPYGLRNLSSQARDGTWVPTTLQWKCGSLTTGPPGKSHMREVLSRGLDSCQGSKGVNCAQDYEKDSGSTILLFLSSWKNEGSNNLLNTEIQNGNFLFPRWKSENNLKCTNYPNRKYFGSYKDYI